MSGAQLWHVRHLCVNDGKLQWPVLNQVDDEDQESLNRNFDSEMHLIFLWCFEVGVDDAKLDMRTPTVTDVTQLQYTRIARWMADCVQPGTYACIGFRSRTYDDKTRTHLYCIRATYIGVNSGVLKLMGMKVLFLKFIKWLVNVEV